MPNNLPRRHAHATPTGCRINRSFQVDPAIYEQIREFALANRYTMAECLEVAIIEFLRSRIKQDDR